MRSMKENKLIDEMLEVVLAQYSGKTSSGRYILRELSRDDLEAVMEFLRSFRLYSKVGEKLDAEA